MREEKLQTGKGEERRLAQPRDEVQLMELEKEMG